jgi:hypothetical protein
LELASGLAPRVTRLLAARRVRVRAVRLLLLLMMVLHLLLLRLLRLLLLRRIAAARGPGGHGSVLLRLVGRLRALWP